MSTSVKLYATSEGKSVNTTFSAINPNATDAELKYAAQALNTLTENTYAKSEKITTVDLDAAVAKLTPSLVITDDIPDGLVASWCLEGRAIKMSYTGDGELYIMNNDNTTWATTFRTNPSTGQLNLYIGIINSATTANATAPHEIVVRSEETDTYSAGEWKFTIIEG